MKNLFLSASLLLSSILVAPSLLNATCCCNPSKVSAACECTNRRAACPCVTKEGGECNCTLRGGECNCAATYAKDGAVSADCPCVKTECCCTPTNPVVEVSYGELFDKTTILEIKKREIKDEQKRSLAIHELEILNKSVDAILAQNGSIKEELLALKEELGNVNWKLWQVEDAVRVKEAQQSFDAEFIHLARSVYKLNHARIELKTKISYLLKSPIVEVKSYAA